MDHAAILQAAATLTSGIVSGADRRIGDMEIADILKRMVAIVHEQTKHMPA